MNKGFKIALGILFITVSLTIFYLGKKIYFMGSQIEREKILEATIWQLSEEGYSKDDIKSINTRYDPISGGDLPYDVIVIFYKDPSVGKIYMWENTSKTKIVNSGEKIYKNI